MSHMELLTVSTQTAAAMGVVSRMNTTLRMLQSVQEEELNRRWLQQQGVAVEVEVLETDTRDLAEGMVESVLEEDPVTDASMDL